MPEDLKKALIDYVKREYWTIPTRSSPRNEAHLGGIVDSFSMVSLKLYLRRSSRSRSR